MSVERPITLMSLTGGLVSKQFPTKIEGVGMFSMWGFDFTAWDWLKIASSVPGGFTIRCLVVLEMRNAL
jgi:hypothetical protein